jgi:hypothetical protein
MRGQKNESGGENGGKNIFSAGLFSGRAARIHRRRRSPYLTRAYGDGDLFEIAAPAFNKTLIIARKSVASNGLALKRTLFLYNR